MSPYVSLAELREDLLVRVKPDTSLFELIEYLFETEDGGIVLRLDFVRDHPGAFSRFAKYMMVLRRSTYTVTTALVEYRSPNPPHNWIEEDGDATVAFYIMRS